MASATSDNRRFAQRASATSACGGRRKPPKRSVELHHCNHECITIDPNKCFGKPCIRDVRMPVTSLLSYLASGMTVEEVLEDWPELELEDIYQAIGYAAWAMTERVLPLEESVSSS